MLKIKRKRRFFSVYRRPSWKKITAILALVVVAVTGAYMFFSQNGNFQDALPVQLPFTGERKVPIYYVETEEKKAAFSFDACWGATYTPDILEILKENNIDTTFFLTGYWVEKHPDMVKKIDRAGHEFGNHTYSHPHLNNLSREQIKAEVERVDAMITELTGNKPELFRPPFGEYSNKVVEAVHEQGHMPIQWSIDSLDWKEMGKEPMVNRVKDNLHPGAIVLFHNNGRYTTEALPEIIDYVKGEGYEIVPISELLYRENYYIDSITGAQVKIEEPEE